MPARVYVDETEVVPLLTKMRLPRWVILELTEQIAGERANVTDDDPPVTAGFETWRWGTRYCREHTELKKLGWERCEKDQISGIKNDALKIKLVVCGTDSNTGNPNRSPRNRSEKGPTSCQLIAKNGSQLSLFPEDSKDDDYDLWYLCGYFCDSHISFEVSRPCSEVAGIVTDWSDRIIIAKPGEIPGIRRHVVPQDFADVPKPRVTRKGG